MCCLTVYVAWPARHDALKSHDSPRTDAQIHTADDRRLQMHAIRIAFIDRGDGKEGLVDQIEATAEPAGSIVGS